MHTWGSLKTFQAGNPLSVTASSGTSYPSSPSLTSYACCISAKSFVASSILSGFLSGWCLSYGLRRLSKNRFVSVILTRSNRTARLQRKLTAAFRKAFFHPTNSTFRIRSISFTLLLNRVRSVPPHLDLVIACLFVNPEEVIVIELRRARRISTAGIPTCL